jgi:methylglutaconyl-CoA hydratase
MMVNLEISNYDAIISLNRPEKRNALSPQLINEFISVFNKCESDPTVKSIIITGAGKAFCAGADLAYLQELRNNSVTENDNDSSLIAKMILTIYESGKPTIAAVNGPAIAGGCGLASACDFIIADTENALFGYSEVKIGFLPAIVSFLLLRRVGEFKARQLLLSAEILNAERAMQFGLADYLSTSVLEDATLLCEKLNLNSSGSIKQTKQLIRTISQLDYKNSVKISQKYNVISRTTEEFYSGIDKFLNKK